MRERPHELGAINLQLFAEYFQVISEEAIHQRQCYLLVVAHS